MCTRRKMFHRFFSRKAKSPDAKSKTPEPPIRSDVSDKSTKTLSMNKASSRPPQIRISNVKPFIFIFICSFVRSSNLVWSNLFVSKHEEKLFFPPPRRRTWKWYRPRSQNATRPKQCPFWQGAASRRSETRYSTRNAWNWWTNISTGYGYSLDRIQLTFTWDGSPRSTICTPRTSICLAWGRGL